MIMFIQRNPISVALVGCLATFEASDLCNFSRVILVYCLGHSIVTPDATQFRCSARFLSSNRSSMIALPSLVSSVHYSRCGWIRAGLSVTSSISPLLSSVVSVTADVTDSTGVIHLFRIHCPMLPSFNQNSPLINFVEMLDPCSVGSIGCTL